MRKTEGTSRRNGKYIFRHFCAMTLTVVASSMFYIRWHEFISDMLSEGINGISSSLLGMGNLGMSIGLYALLYYIVGKWLHAFAIGVERKSGVVAGQVLTLFTVDFFETFLSCAITNQFRIYFRLLGLYSILFVVQAVTISILTAVMVDIYRRIFPPLKLVEFFGEYKDDLSFRLNCLKFKYEVSECFRVEQDDDSIRNILGEYDAALIGDVPAHERNRLVKICFEMNKRVYYVPKISDVLVKNSQELNLIDAPLFLNKNNGMGPLKRFVKRSFDLVLSALSLIFFSPVMLITALAIKIEDGGPVFFKQERVTIGGKRFMILKFRSMIVDAEKDGKPHPAGEHDDRITRVGRFIRTTRIDELPQLINIFSGDMSIVGPRPERWEHVEQYCREIPEFAFRTKVKGGLTGYAQVYGKYNTSPLDKLKLDLLYITDYSFLLDLQIIFQTLKILFVKESTDGFTENASRKIHDASVSKSSDIQ